MRHLTIALVLSVAACRASVRDPFGEAVDKLSAELGERVIVDRCPAARLTTSKQICRAHVASGAAFDLEAEREGLRLNLRVVGMASGRRAAAELYRVYDRRGLELPDMQCPVLIPFGRAVACTGVVRGVPVVAMATASERRFDFELTHGVISGAGMAKSIGDTGLAPGQAEVDCNFDLRLSMPGTEIACGVAPGEGSRPRAVWVRIEDTDGHVVMGEAQHPRVD
jgi:hypothetical protein